MMPTLFLMGLKITVIAKMEKHVPVNSLNLRWIFQSIKRNRRKAKMKQLEKEINVTNKQNIMKRYKMYGATVSKLVDKSKNDTKNGEKK